MTNVADLCQRLSKLQIKHRVMYPKKQLMFKDIESRFECLQHVFKDFTWDDLDKFTEKTFIAKFKANNRLLARLCFRRMLDFRRMLERKE
jgi:hypothetical protein